MHPIIFQLQFSLFGHIFHPALRSYGVATAISFALGILLSVYLNRKDGRHDDQILDLSVWVMLGAITGARLLYVIVQPAEYLANPFKILAIYEGGLVFYGGLIGAGLVAYWHLRRTKAPIWAVGDVVAPGLALGHVTGRLGCYFNGCCYGREDQGLGVVFPNLGDGIPHLPVMLYEAAFLLLLSAFLYLLWHKKRFDGQVFWAYVLLYAGWRFCIEYLRGDAERGVLINAALSPSQWISVFGAGLALIMFYRLSRLPRTKGSRS